MKPAPTHAIALAITLSLSLQACGPKKPIPEPPRSHQERPGDGAPAGRPAEPEGTLTIEDRLHEIHFDLDRADIRPDAVPVLRANAEAIRSVLDARVVIEGHADERGSIEYNLALGERRAAAARNYLQRLGIPASRLSTVSYGKERPADPDHTEEAWAENRRAAFLAVK